ncbi:MAG: hypothetical protein KGZ38_04270 [Erysipelothrix sp.]|nr:hypothetical protein [Erysipelothrix sp.]
MIQLEFIVLYFIYGLAFFAMGLTSFLSYSKNSYLLFRRKLLYLSLFGLIHGFTEWLIMFNRTQLFMEYNDLLSFLISSTFSISFMFLAYFGFNISKNLSGKKFIFKSMLLLIGLAVVINFASYFFFSNGYLSLDYFEFRFINRILTALPASLLTAIALFIYAKEENLKGVGTLSRIINLLGWLFIVYAISVGVVGENVELLWASFINNDIFQSFFRIPIELIRILSAVLISVCVLLIIREFEIENEIKRKEVDEIYLRSFENKKTASLLHDVVLQHLFVVNLKLKEFSLKHGENSQVNEAQESINQVMVEIRNFLNSPQVRYVSIKEINNEITQLIKNRITDFKNIQFSFEIDSLLFGHQNTIRTEHIKLILNELINNTIKHAQAKVIKIQMNVNQHTLTMRYSDDGRGFIAKPTSGYGISSIQHRLQLCEGTYQFKTNEKGSSYVFEFPWIWE